jgi:hypothetical protein
MQYTQLPPAQIEYHGIRFDTEGVSSTVHGNPRILFEKKDVVEVRLRRALRAESPLAQAFVGLVLFLVGIFPLFKLLQGLIYGSFNAWYLAGLPLLPLGAWLAVSVFRSRMCLEVVTGAGRYKLFFQGELDLPEVMHFLKQGTEMGYPLTTVKAMERSGEAAVKR